MAEPLTDTWPQPDLADPLRAAAPEDEELVLYLERDQFVADTSQPVPPAVLGRRTRIALWSLRVFVLVLSAMVIVTFIAALR